MTMKMLSTTWFVALGSAATVLGCGTGGGSLARLVRPKQPTAAGALGETPKKHECLDVSGAVRPLVVDLRPEQRGDLEVAMKDGVAIVRYDCDGLELLTDCRAEGSYGFKGIVLKQQLIRLADEDEVKANLPLTGVAVAAKLGTELERGTTLDLATALVGNITSTRLKLERSELAGICEGASHFVRGANIGAFVMQTGSESELVSAAQVFGVGAGTNSASSRLSRVEDGRLDDCEHATPDATDPPGNCQALIRLHLIPITTGGAKTATARSTPSPTAVLPPAGTAPAAAGTATSTSPSATAAAPAATTETTTPPSPSAAAEAAAAATKSSLDDDEAGCPESLVLSEGKCVAVEKAKTHLCTGEDPEDCRTQCDAGDVKSCARLASLYARGAGVAADANLAATLYSKACDGDHGTACSRLGILAAQGKGTTRDEAKAAALFEKACRLGEADGCFNLGVLCYDGAAGVVRDFARAFTLFQQACDAGKAAACVNVGAAYDDGEGVEKDPQKAFALFKRACEGDEPAGCFNLAYMYSQGSGVTADQALAARAYERACTLGNAEGCSELAGRYLSGSGVEKNVEQGNAMLGRACDLGFEPACTRLGRKEP
ncbi:MAG: sel1 repeat family protein [Polyangiaceae bacterium]|nr:sel1 repeat family protein [Polyangiaceae bacterium]